MKRALIALALCLSFLAGLAIPSVTQPSAARALPPLSVTQLHAGVTQIWMAAPFCVSVWWGPVLCSENKGDELHVGAPFKLDLPAPAWLALEGRDSAGRWALWAVAKDNEQSPGALFVAVTGACLVAVNQVVTPSPVTPFPATVTAPPQEATATPTVASGATLTPSPPGSIPTLSPAQKRAFTIYCDLTGRGYGMTLWGSYGLTYNVPDEWCAPSRDANEELLRRMAEATPAWIEVRP